MRGGKKNWKRVRRVVLSLLLAVVMAVEPAGSCAAVYAAGLAGEPRSISVRDESEQEKAADNPVNDKGEEAPDGSSEDKPEKGTDNPVDDRNEEDTDDSRDGKGEEDMDSQPGDDSEEGTDNPADDKNEGDTDDSGDGKGEEGTDSQPDDDSEEGTDNPADDGNEGDTDDSGDSRNEEDTDDQGEEAWTAFPAAGQGLHSFLCQQYGYGCSLCEGYRKGKLQWYEVGLLHDRGRMKRRKRMRERN